MFNLQGSEIIVILLLALVVLGPEKLPDAIRRFSRTYAELKKMGSGFQSELKSALDEPMREMRETADLVMHAADPQKLSEEAEAEIAARTLADEEAREVAEPIDERAFLVNDPSFERAAEQAARGSAGAARGSAGAARDRGTAATTPVNRVAAANSSAAIAAASAAAAATPEDAAGETEARDEGADRDAGAVGDGGGGASPDLTPAEQPRANGPAFQSAAPRSIQQADDRHTDEAVIDDAAGEDANEGAAAS